MIKPVHLLAGWLSLGSHDTTDTVVATRLFRLLFALGLFYGACIEPRWLYNQYFAQLISGITHCPTDSVTYLLNGSTYTLIAQIPALLLKAGVDEWSLNVLSSAIFTALAFSAVGMATLTLSRMPLLALLLPLAMLTVRLVPDHFYAVLYPADLSIFGIVAMFYALLTLARTALGFKGSALFLTGLAPAIHPTWALAVWCLVFLVLWLRNEPLLTRENLTALLAGLLLFAISYAAHRLWVMPPTESVPAQAIETVVQAWREGLKVGNHHQMIGNSPTPIRHALFFFLPEITLALLSWFSVRRTRPLIQGNGRILLQALWIFTGVLVAVRVGHELFASQLPWQIDLLLYNRWLNLNTVVNIILIVSLLTRLVWLEGNPMARFAMLFLALITLGSAIYRRHLPITPCFDCALFPNLPAASVAMEGVLLLFFLSVLLSTRMERLPLGGGRRFPPLHWSLHAADKWLLGVVLLSFTVRAIIAFRPAQIVDEWAYHRYHRHIKRECQQDWPAFQKRMAESAGGLVMGPGTGSRAGINKTVLYSTRQCSHTLPVGGHPYSPASLSKAKAFNKAFMCGDETGKEGFPESLQTCWQSMEPHRWREEAMPHGITQILADERWQLKLQPLQTWCGVTLYAIPVSPDHE
ncbi:MAG: hypothetical protein HQL88_07180 [Magnetococcales bacterium]|nr:hypothetical protein [Magnetococcales bacterium]